MELFLKVDWEKQEICLSERPAEPHLRWTIRIEDIILKGDKLMLTMTDTQKCILSIQPVDAHGHPAAIDGLPTWTVSDPTILTLQPNPADPNGTIVLAVGAIGNAQVNVEADADLGAGVIPLTGLLDVTIVASQAVSLEITPGIPEPQ